MSMIQEQIEDLKVILDEFNDYSIYENGEDYIVGEIVENAIYIIETLSAKLSAANMQRSKQYYDGGWIPCGEMLPEENQELIVTFENSAGIWVDTAIFFKNEFYYVTDTENGYYEEKYTNVIAWMPLPKPYKSNLN